MLTAWRTRSPQILAGEFHEARAEENVIMDVVNPERKIGQPNFGGIRLELHPRGMY